MRLNINLASQPYEDARRFWMRWGTGLALLVVLTLALVALTLSGFFVSRRDRQKIRDMQHQIAARNAEKATAEAFLNRPENRTMRDRSQFLNDLFQRKAFSWTKVFENLEQVMPPRLHVVSIHPELTPDNQLEIKLVVAGESRDRALELVRKMEGSQRFQQTRIEQESAQTGQMPGDNVRFDIRALYVPEVGTKPSGEITTRQGGAP